MSDRDDFWDNPKPPPRRRMTFEEFERSARRRSQLTPPAWTPLTFIWIVPLVMVAIVSGLRMLVRR